MSEMCQETDVCVNKDVNISTSMLGHRAKIVGYVVANADVVDEEGDGFIVGYFNDVLLASLVLVFAET